MTAKTKIIKPGLIKAKLALLPQSIAESVIQWLPISLILTLATVLFSYGLGREGLWLDELNSVQDVTQNSALSYLEHPVRPLYYLVLMGWMQFGSSDVWLRIPSVAFAIVSVLLLYRIGRRLMGETEGLIAALLLAISPVVINHAQEIRMYTLSLCLGLAGTLFLVDALLVERPQRPKETTIAGWALFRVLAMYTVPLNILLLLPDVLAIALRFRQQKATLLKFGKWLLILLVLWSPAVLSVAAASSPSSTYASDHSGDSPPDAASVVRLFKFLSAFPVEYERLWLVLDGLTQNKAMLEAAIAQNYSVEISFDYEQGSKVMLLRPLDKSLNQAALPPVSPPISPPVSPLR